MDSISNHVSRITGSDAGRRPRRAEPAAPHLVIPPAGPVSVSHVADALRRAIVTGSLKPAARLSEAALEAEFGAGRDTVRDALLALEGRGLVTHEPRRGWRVRAHDEASIRQVYALRGLLERHAVAGLMESEADLDGLIAALTAANTAMEKKRAAGDAEGYLKANEHFHVLFLRHAPNEPLRLAIELLNDMAAPLRLARLTADLAGSTAVEEHGAIIEMLGAGDVDAAVDAMHDHILGNADATVAAAL